MVKENPIAVREKRQSLIDILCDKTSESSARWSLYRARRTNATGLRRRSQIQGIHRLGERAFAELAEELERYGIADLDVRLAKYAPLEADLLRAVGADRFPDGPRQGTGRTGTGQAGGLSSRNIGCRTALQPEFIADLSRAEAADWGARLGANPARSAPMAGRSTWRSASGRPAHSPTDSAPASSS